MQFNNKPHNIPSFTDDSEFDEATDPGLDRMATQHVVDPGARQPTGGFPAPYINPTSAPAQGFHGQHAPQLTPPFNNHTGGFQKVPTGFISTDQLAGELSSPGFQPQRISGSFEQLSSAGMMSPGFQSQNTTGSFEQLSSAGMMSPGFQSQNTTGSFEQLSSARMMSPGFLQPNASKQTTQHSPNIIAKIRLRYVLAATSCGAIVGFLFGILNTLMQGWEINQGTPQLMILVGLFSIAFGVIAYFRKERIDELLTQANLKDVIEFLNSPALTAQKTHPQVNAPLPSFQPPSNALYPRSPSGTFQTTDPDRTDEIPIL